MGPSGPASRRAHPALLAQVQLATPADHAGIERFLQGIFHDSSSGEFQAQLEEPAYEPTDRLLIKNGKQVIAHVRLARREMMFGSLVLPVVELTELATAPEYQGQGLATALIHEAETQFAEDSVLAVLRTNLPHYFAQRGWSLSMRHSYSTAAPREILSHLHAQHDHTAGDTPRHLSGATTTRPLNIRLWRHVEQAALTRLYESNAESMFGPYRRSDAYWRWLISRRGYDRIYVAIDGPNKLELGDALHRIVGYAAMREGRIAELMTAAQRQDVGLKLVARACGDAIERDYHLVRLDAAPDDPLHQAFAAAGGAFHYHEAENGYVNMVRVPDPVRLLELLCPLIARRAHEAGMPLPAELGLAWEDAKLRLVVNRRSAKLLAGKLGRSYVRCRTAELIQLALGHLAVQEGVDAGKLERSTAVAAQSAAVLLPRLPVWRPPLDHLCTLDG